MRCVRPDLTTSLNLRALRSKERSSCLRAGSSWLVASSSAARCTADGKTSLDDWPKFTWSLGGALPPVSDEMTSLVFMLDEVPEPVWKTSIGNWLSCSPAAIAAPASAISCASALSRLPSSALTRAAVPLIRPSQRMTETGTVSPEIGKLSTAFLVSPPYSVFFFTGGIDPGAYPSGGLSPFGLEAADRARDVQRGAGLELEVVDEHPLVHAVLGHE